MGTNDTHGTNLSDGAMGIINGNTSSSESLVFDGFTSRDLKNSPVMGWGGLSLKKMSKCQKDVKMSKRCQNVKKMSNYQKDVKLTNVKKSNLWTMKEVHKNNKLT